MAIDKSRTSNGMKVGVIILIIAFVGGIGGLAANLGSSGGTPQQQAASTTASGLEQISQSEMAVIAPNEQALKAKPNDYQLLKTLGDNYFDYALKVQQASPTSGLDLTIWQRATDYYRRALAVTPGDPAVTTDMAITQFYGNDLNGAIATIEPVLKKDPTFAQAPFNAGIFYKEAGDTVKAKAAFDTYLKLEPNGNNSANAKRFLGELNSGGAQAAPSSSAGTAPASAPATK